MGNDREQGSDAASSIMTAADQLRAARGDFSSSVSIEKELPEFAKFWPRDGQGRIVWPEPDPANPGNIGNRARLEKFLLSFMRVFLPSEVESTNVWNTRRLFWFIQRDLKASGRPQWDQKFYNQAWRNADHSFGKEEAERAEEQLDANPPPPSAAGRKPTDRTARVQLIRETIGVSRHRAYGIDRDGTGNLQDRIALAAAFTSDPERDTPAKWELKFGGKHGRPSARRTFADYVMSYDDAFEEDLGPALATLRRVYARGTLPRSFNDLRAFIGAMHGLGIGEATSVRLWDCATSWCDGN